MAHLTQTSQTPVAKWLLRALITALICAALFWARIFWREIQWIQTAGSQHTIQLYIFAFLTPAKLLLIAFLFHMRTAAAVWVLGVVLVEGVLLSGIADLFQSHGILAWIKLGAFTLALAILGPILFFLNRRGMVTFL